MSKSLILNILSSLPSKREALSFLRKVNPNLKKTINDQISSSSSGAKSAKPSTLSPPRLCLVLVAEPALLLSSTHLKFLANNLTELCHLGILPLVVLDHGLNGLSAPTASVSMSTSTRNPHLYNQNQNSNGNGSGSSSVNSSIPSRKWPQINAAFQLAEQIDVAEGPVRGIPIYADYAYTETHGHSVDNVTLDLSAIKSHLSSMLSLVLHILF